MSLNMSPHVGLATVRLGPLNPYGADGAHCRDFRSSQLSLVTIVARRDDGLLLLNSHCTYRSVPL
jgi:hypothetical protein